MSATDTHRNLFDARMDYLADLADRYQAAVAAGTELPALPTGLVSAVIPPRSFR